MITAEEIKQLRAKLCITQKELAEKIGVSRNTIINYEAGAAIPVAKQRLLQCLLMDVRNNTSNNIRIVNNNKSVNNEGTIKDRLQVIINKLFNGKKANFCRVANISPTILSNTIGTRQSKPSSDFIASIIIGLPQINSDWLLTGKGEMLKTSSGIIANTGSIENTVIERIKQLCAKEGLNVNELAKILNIPQRTTNSYINEGRIPSFEFIEKLVNTFKLDANWLLIGKGEMLKPSTENVQTLGSIVINLILAYEKLNPNQFAQSIGLKSTQPIYDIVNGKVKKISANYANRIIKFYPHYNFGWLTTGKGEMLKTSSKNNSSNVYNEDSINESALTLENITSISNNDQQILLLKNEIKHLNKLLAEKERVIQVLLKNN